MQFQNYHQKKFRIQVIMTLAKLLAFQPLVNQRKSEFIAWKIVQVLSFFAFIAFFVVMREHILYMEDVFGTVADYYLAIISFVSCFIVIIEPAFFYCQYVEFNAVSVKFLEHLNEDFGNVFDSKEITKKIKRKLTKIAIGFAIFYVIFEANKFFKYMFNKQTKNVAFFFLVFATIIYSEIWRIVHQMLIIQEYLLIIKKLMKQINNDIHDNLEINLRDYNAIIHRKYTKVIMMYGLVQHMVALFNKFGVSQMTVFLATKLYLIGEFYWIALVTMHNRIRIGVTYS
jgi:uncharacterized membrane protein